MDELQSVMEAYDKSYADTYQRSVYKSALEFIAESTSLEEAKDWATWALEKAKEAANVGSHPGN